MSYVRSDDNHEDGRLTQFCARLGGEVRMQTGDPFDIFQDRKDILWGQEWAKRIGTSLDSVTILVPIITPGFFKSEACRSELEQFLKHEETLGRKDLILPVYYVDCPLLVDEAKRAKDPLAELIASRQHADWRDLRFVPFTAPEVGKRFVAMAVQIVEALDRVPTATKRVSKAAPSSVDLVGSEPEAKVRKATASSKRRQKPATRTEPPTVVVDALHQGDYVTLTEALKQAKPGTRILVRPGTYKEGVVIDKPVEIVGDGELADIVIEASGRNAVLFRADMGRITNLTLRQKGGGDWYCVDIGQGRLDLEGCDVSSQGSACIGIHGGADPRIRRCSIHDGKQSGVFVYENGEGTLEDNEIFANTLAGVEIKTGGKPVLRRNRIHDGKSTGSCVHDNGEGILEDNEIFANASAGVLIKTGGRPVLRRNRIHDGKTGGVLICENGEGTLEDNEILANAFAGVEIRTSGKPALRRNRIHNGKSVGVYVHESGEGTLEDNEIFANALAGVLVKTDGKPTLRRNRIHDGEQGGVLVYDNGEGTLEGNEIFANAFAGVEIRTGGKPVLRRNRIHDGKSVGVYVNENGKGTLEGNEILANASAGVEIATGGGPVMRRNQINQNQREGIWIREDGNGVFEGNDLRGNARGAWKIAPDAEAKVKRSGNWE